MIKKLVTAILTFCIFLGCITTSFAAEAASEPMLKIRLYAPNYMLNYLDSILSYGAAYTDNTGEQKVFTVSEENHNDGTLGKYENNRKLLIPASQFPAKNIDYIFVTVTLRSDDGRLDKRTYYYNSDGTSSLFKEGFVWSGNKDLDLLLYLDSAYVITIKNDLNINNYYIKPRSTVDLFPSQQSAEEPTYDIERGESKYFDYKNINTTLICKNDHVYVPVKSLAEIFGFKVEISNSDNNTELNITSPDGKIKVILLTDSDAYIKNGDTSHFKDGMMPFQSDGITYVPVRFLEVLDIGVEYSSARNMIYLKPRTYK